MGELSLKDKFILWLEALPIRLAYRIVWFSAKLGSPLAQDVYDAMWEANLALPELNNESNP